MSINIRIIETGSIRVRPSLITQPPGNVLLRRLKFLSDRQWTDPIPIYAFLITHPEGNFLFDLGETPKCIQKGYFPWWQVGQYCVSMDIKPDQGLGSQLRAQGIDPEVDIRAAIVSHLHSDHAGGLPDIYGKADVFVSQSHWDAFQKPFYATMEGANPSAWPEGFAPSILKPDGPAIGPWKFSYPITKDGKILAVDTPGHVPGHVSLIIIDDDVTYLLVGDAAYSLELLDKEMVDGINSDPYVALESQKMIKEFCSQRPVVVLPSHEYDSVRRLEAKEVYQPSKP
ncbi:beta-lactamase-like protein [Hypoxylon rubiginosum]|uniref:Beta-lactamase-like protein n=1 Tax=Hypoxylon rubiginosum TaxID=110542 RepID=A0ACC0DA31_9PEZI|nr:beta-lactamase-like protein [Hypoxylon rubiginosum]